MSKNKEKGFSVSYKYYKMILDFTKKREIPEIKHPGIEIRKYNKEKDFSEFVNLYNYVNMQTVDPHLPTYTESEFKMIPNDMVFLAEIDDKLVGYIICFIRDDIADKEFGQYVDKELANYVSKKERLGVLGEIGVLKEYRRKGVATALALRVGKYFKKQNVDKIYAEVYAENVNAIKFIKSFGFKKIGMVVVSKDEVRKPHPRRIRMGR
ncbi:MAG: GNAT family N-acetyltransferase [Candidatus Lokiarchaeota archaeon]|nr:GNAT family N-acetyltransferase [Candidatus Lokiarchaeota archaeon]